MRIISCPVVHAEKNLIIIIISKTDTFFKPVENCETV